VKDASKKDFSLPDLAIFVKSSFTSHATTTPSGGSARAAAKELAPVKTPMSMTFLVPWRAGTSFKREFCGEGGGNINKYPRL